MLFNMGKLRKKQFPVSRIEKIMISLGSKLLLMGPFSLKFVLFRSNYGADIKLTELFISSILIFIMMSKHTFTHHTQTQRMMMAYRNLINILRNQRCSMIQKSSFTLNIE